MGIIPAPPERILRIRRSGRESAPLRQLGGRRAFRVGYLLFLCAALWPDVAPEESFPPDALFEPLSAFPVDVSPLPLASALESVASLV